MSRPKQSSSPEQRTKPRPETSTVKAIAPEGLLPQQGQAACVSDSPRRVNVLRFSPVRCWGHTALDLAETVRTQTKENREANSAKANNFHKSNKYTICNNQNKSVSQKYQLKKATLRPAKLGETTTVAMSFGFDEPETGATIVDGGGDDGLCCCDAAMWQKMSNYHRGLNSTTMTTTATLNDQEAFFFASTTMLATENVAMSFGFDELKVVWFNVLNDACCLLLAVAAGCCCLLLAVCW